MAEPLADLHKTYQNNTNNLIANATLSYYIQPNLMFRSSFGYNSIQSREIQSNPMKSINPDYRSFTERTAGYGNKRINSWIIEPQLSYKRSLGKGKLDVLLGATVQRNSDNGEIVYGFGYNSDLLLNDIRSAARIGGIIFILQRLQIRCNI